MINLILLAPLMLTCPQVIEVQQMAKPVEGWETFDPQIPHKYYFAQFSDGPPERLDMLMHDKESWSGKNKVLHYEFLTSQTPWLICSYTGTSSVLARRLPAAIRSCRLTLDHAHNKEFVSAIHCD